MPSLCYRSNHAVHHGKLVQDGLRHGAHQRRIEFEALLNLLVSFRWQWIGACRERQAELDMGKSI